MASADEIQVVPLQELLELLSAKDKAATSLIFLPVSGILIWIVPQEVGDEAAIRDIRRFGDLLDLFKTMHVFRDATVHTHDLLVDEGYQRHVVEAIPKGLPESDLVPSLNFVEESVNPGNGLTLVVTSQDDYLVRVSDLKGK